MKMPRSLMKSPISVLSACCIVAIASYAHADKSPELANAAKDKLKVCVLRHLDDEKSKADANASRLLAKCTADLDKLLSELSPHMAHEVRHILEADIDAELKRQ